LKTTKQFICTLNGSIITYGSLLKVSQLLKETNATYFSRIKWSSFAIQLTLHVLIAA